MLSLIITINKSKRHIHVINNRQKKKKKRIDTISDNRNNTGNKLGPISRSRSARSNTYYYILFIKFHPIMLFFP